MDEAALREALVDRMRQHYAPAIERIAERRAKQAAMSDDERWERYLAPWSKRRPEIAEKIAEHKESFLRAQREADQAIAPDTLNNVARHKAKAILPHLIEVRAGVEGPITEEQFTQAQMKASLAEIEASKEKLRRAAERTIDPRKKVIATMLAQNVGVDLAELASLTDSDLTEERLKEVTDGIVERMKALTETV